VTTLENLVDELGIDKVTSESFARDKARLVRTFLVTYGCLAEDIDELIRAGDLSEADDLVQEWIALHELAPFVEMERPPETARPSGPLSESRESGSFFLAKRGTDSEVTILAAAWTTPTAASLRRPSDCWNCSGRES